MLDDTQLPYDSFETSPPVGSASRTAAVLGFLLPLACIGAGVVGLALGAAGGWMAHPETRVVESEPVYDVSDIRFVAACLPMVAEKTTRIEELNLEISDLRDQVSQKAARVKELESKTVAHGGRGGGASSADLANAKEELANLRLQYAQVMTEKANLVAQLTETQQQLAVAETAVTETRVAYEQQLALTDAAEEDASANKYARFLGESQLAVCEKGGRKKMGDCRSELTVALSASPVRDTFFRCVRSGQAVPVVREAEANASLPTYSKSLGESRVLKGWYVTNCDPTLPEARLARATPPAYTPLNSAFSVAASYFPMALTGMAPVAAMVPTQLAPPPIALEPAGPSVLEDTLLSLASVLPAAAAAYIAPAPPPPPVRVAPPMSADPLGLDDVDVGPYIPVAARTAAPVGDGVNIDDILGQDDPATKARPAAPPAAPAKGRAKEEAPSRNYDLADDLAGLEDL